MPAGVAGARGWPCRWRPRCCCWPMLQAATGLLPAQADPLARLLGVGMKDVADRVAAEVRRAGADAVLTSDYETTAWLRFYAPELPLIAVNQPDRYLEASSAVLAGGSYLYFRDMARDQRHCGGAIPACRQIRGGCPRAPRPPDRHLRAVAAGYAEKPDPRQNALNGKRFSDFGEKRADTRGGLSKGLGAFRIGRPLGINNDGPGRSFRPSSLFFKVFAPCRWRLFPMALRRR